MKCSRLKTSRWSSEAPPSVRSRVNVLSLSVPANVAVALSGCVVRYSSRADSTGSNATSPVGVSSGSPLGNAIIIGVMAADAAHYYRLIQAATTLDIAGLQDFLLGRYVGEAA